MDIDATTKEVLAGLDHSVRPQDDLFRHVNGEWLKTATIPDDQSSTGSFIDLRNQSEVDVRNIIEDLKADSENLEEAQIAGLYESFMDETRVNALGAAPLSEDFDLINAATSKDELAAVLGGLLPTGVDVPAYPYVSNDKNNPDANVVYLYQSGLGLPDESFYREESYAEILAAYREFVPVLWALATGAEAEVSQDAARAILDIESAFASHHLTPVQMRDAEKTNNVMSFADFVDSAPGFAWVPFFAAAGLTEENMAQLIVTSPSTMQGFAQQWQNAELQDLRTYVTWHTILARAPYLSDEISQANFNFYGKVLQGSQVQRDRWKRAVGFVNDAVGEAVGKRYVAKHFPPRSKELMDQLVADLLQAYRESITALDWMTEETKAKALDKLDHFTTKIGYPEKWIDYSALEVNVDDLVGNVRASARFEWARQIEKLSQPVDRSEWLMTPQTVNAYYMPPTNEIAFPAAILQPPFFQPDADPAWNYGAIGAVIGHEIGHGFDDQGSKYDGTGQLNNWWTDADRAEFEKRTAALVGQYDAYIPAQLGEDSPHHVQGALTLGENIGDLGGLSIGLKAYDIACKRAGLAGAQDAPVIEGYTGIQRAFLAYGRIWQEIRRDELMIQRVATDPHSPAEFRANGVVKNVDAFAQAFDVTEGDALYLAPDERVHIW